MKRALAVVALASGLAVGRTATATAPDATGWWTRTRVSVLPVQAPTTVPAGGLYVAGDPTGPLGVSAVRFTLARDEFPQELVLQIASAQGTPAVQACPVAVPWTPVEGGELAAAPAPDCASGLAFGAADASTVRIPVGGLVRDGVVDIRLEPQPGTLFQAAFHRPDHTALSVTPIPLPSEEAPPPPLTGPVAELPVVSEAEPFLVEVAPPAPAAVPAEPLSGEIASGPSIGFVPAAVPAGDDEASSGRDRLIAVILLLQLVAFSMHVLSEQSRGPRLIGPLAGALELRGVGRFVRPRTGRAPRL